MIELLRQAFQMLSCTRLLLRHGFQGRLRYQVIAEYLHRAASAHGLEQVVEEILYLAVEVYVCYFVSQADFWSHQWENK